MATYLTCNSKKKYPRTFNLTYLKTPLTFNSRNSKVCVSDEIADRLIRDNPLLFNKSGFIDDEQLAEIKRQAVEDAEAANKEQESPEAEDNASEEDQGMDMFETLTRQQIADKIFEDFQVKISIAGKNKADMIAKYREIEATPEDER